MRKKFLTYIVSVIAVFTASTIFASEEMPMKCFKNFRDVIIADDSFGAIPFIADDQLSDQIRQNGIPRALRRKIIAVKAAYEDVNIRKTTPEKAVIYAFFTEKKEEKCLKLTFKSEYASWKLAGYSETFPLAKDCVENFLARCAAGEAATLKEFLTPELQAKTDGIPVGLRPEAAEGFNGKIFQVSGGTSRGRSDSVNVKFLADSGRISLVRDGYFWKITAIDNSLTSEKPVQFIKRFCRECKNPPPAAKAVPAEGTATGSGKAEETPAEGADENQFAYLAEFFTPGSMAEMKETLAANISRTAGFQSVKRQTISSSPEVEVAIDTTGETGSIIFKLKRQADKWTVSQIDASAVFAKDAAPDKIAEKYVNSWFGDGKAELVKDLTTPEFNASLANATVTKYENPVFSFPESKVNGLYAEVKCLLSSGDKKSEFLVKLKLSDNHWLVYGATEPTAIQESTEPAE